MKFLETITFLGSDALVPIDRINWVNFKIKENGFEILIKSDDGEWAECFDHKEEKKADARYKQIKKILEAE